MPITRTVNGFLIHISCDDYEEEGWEYYFHGPISIENDTTDKQEGTASQKVFGGTGTPGSGGWRKNNVPMVDGSRIHCWTKMLSGNFDKKQLRIDEGDTLLFETGQHAWELKKVTVPAVIGSKGYTTGLKHHITNWTNVSGSYLDHITITRSQYVTVTGLSPGQKVQIYRSEDDYKIDEQTCAEGQTSVALDIDTEEYPLYCYLKVYATDTATLVEVTGNYTMCGGDEWYWISPFGTLDVDSTAYIIYRTASSDSPTSADVTATLKTPAGDPYPDVTVYFETSKGAVSPTSDVTDENGEAHTTLTSHTHGIAVVKANWPGDASVPAAVAYATHHVMYNVEVPDADKKFQLFIEGIEFAYSTGRYVLCTDTTPQEFSVEIPEWLDTITRRGIVNIYRKGVKEFTGILMVPDRIFSENPRVLLSGVDSKAVLDTRVVTTKDYSAKTFSYILDDLLESFWSGVVSGDLDTYPASLTMTFQDESLISSVTRLCDWVGWQFRMNEFALDAKQTFGESKPVITFTQGINLFVNAYRLDDRQPCNSIRMRGNEDLVSTVYDGVSIGQIGLIEDVAFQKSITTQATLDIAALAELSRRAGQGLSLQAIIIDTYEAGSWGLDDWVTLVVPEHDINELLKVVRIERVMTDPNVAIVDFANKLNLEWSDLWVRLRRELKDLSAKTAI